MGISMLPCSRIPIISVIHIFSPPPTVAANCVLLPYCLSLGDQTTSPTATVPKGEIRPKLASCNPPTWM